MERDAAIAEQKALNNNMDVKVNEAVREAKAEERHHHSSDMKKEKGRNETLQAQLNGHKEKMTELLNRTVTSEIRQRMASRESTKLARCSKDLTNESERWETDMKMMEKENNTLRNALAKMECLLADTAKKVAEMGDLVPIKEIAKHRDGRRGSSLWPLYVWELILEQLVNGTPPSSVNDNIILHVRKFSPSTTIKELPSIWTIWRARTVLLVVCQCIATYRLAKADRWEQLFTDATGRRQVNFQNLVISIEEDELFQ
jgi:hypothetical protein